MHFSLHLQHEQELLFCELAAARSVPLGPLQAQEDLLGSIFPHPQPQPFLDSLFLEDPLLHPQDLLGSILQEPEPQPFLDSLFLNDSLLHPQEDVLFE